MATKDFSSLSKRLSRLSAATLAIALLGTIAFRSLAQKERAGHLLEADSARYELQLPPLGLGPEGSALRYPSPHLQLAHLRADSDSNETGLTESQQSDLWLLPGEQAQFYEGQAYNLTRTSAVSEEQLIVSGPFALLALPSKSGIFIIKLFDFRGLALPQEWSGSQKFRAIFANFQDFGHPKGIEVRSFRLSQAVQKLDATFTPDHLELKLHTGELRIPLETHLEHNLHAEELTPPPAEPGNWVTWAVDRARASSWIGDENIQVLKAVAYKAYDRYRLWRGVKESDEEALTLGSHNNSAASTKLLDSTLIPSNWPPKNIPSLFSDSFFPEEGIWNTLEGDPYVNNRSNQPSTFATTFIRPERERSDVKVVIVVWDPRRITLHPVGGTEEPRSATGEVGDGLIPRDKETMGNLVAALNGGFQTSHGNWGIRAEGTDFVPPVPYAATIGSLRDGSTVFGTWPEQDEVPDELLSYRQNLTPLLVDGKWNPYGRLWWGGVPDGWNDDTRSVRSAICGRKDGLIAYFYGDQIGPSGLAEAMKIAECNYGMHLDMNQGHVGMEFYRVVDRGSFDPIEIPPGSIWETQRSVPESEQYEFRSRRLFRNMQLMHFPRYIKRQRRDYFYLQLQHHLPPGDAPELKWRLYPRPDEAYPPLAVQASIPKGEDGAALDVSIIDLSRASITNTPGSAKNSVEENKYPLHLRWTQNEDFRERVDSVQFFAETGQAGFKVAPRAPLGSHTIIEGTESAAGACSAFGLNSTRSWLIIVQSSDANCGLDDTSNLPSEAALRTALQGFSAELLGFRTQNISIHTGAIGESPRSKDGRHRDLHSSLYWLQGRSLKSIFNDTAILPRSHWKPLQNAKRTPDP